MSWNLLTVGELRAAIADLPDDTQLVADGAEEDCEASEMRIHRFMPPALDQPGLLVFEFGQVITSEIDYHPRLDVWLDMPTSQSWDDRAKKWRTR